MNAPFLRETYRPSGRVDPIRFPIAVVVLCAVAVADVCVRVSFMQSGDPRGVAIALPMAMVIALVAGIGVSMGHCRNPTTGCVAGASAGLVMLLGPHIWEAYLADGWTGILRVDLLAVRLSNEMSGPVLMVAFRHLAPSTVIAMSRWVGWVVAPIGILVVTLLPIWFIRFSRYQIYGEHARRWMSRISLQAPAEAVDILSRELPTTSLTTLMPKLDWSMAPNLPQGDLEVYYVRGFAATNDPDPVFLSLELLEPRSPPLEQPVANEDGSGPWQAPTTRQTVSVRKIKHVGGPWRLDKDEVEALVHQFPAVRQLFGFPAIDEAPPWKSAAVEVAGEGGLPTAEIVQVPRESVQRIAERLGRWFRLRNLALLAVCALAFVVAVISATKAITKGMPGVMVELLSGPVSAVAASSLVVLALSYRHKLVGRLFRRIARQEIAMRADRWIDPKQPHLRFIKVVPRDRWHTFTDNRPGAINVLDLSFSEVGFLELDSANRQMTFEGMAERWRIPSESVASVKLETLLQDEERPTDKRYSFVILQARLVDGTLREIPLEAYSVGLPGPDSNRSRQRETETLFAAITALVERRRVESQAVSNVGV